MEILIIFLLTILNGILAMSEAALISARKTRLQNLADEGDRRARITLEMTQNPNHFLSTIQIGITLIGILAGAFGGATIATNIGRQLAVIPGLASYSDTIGVLVVVLFTTYISLVIGELVPKRLALQDPERIALAVSPWLRGLSILTRPVVRLLGVSTDVILRLIGKQVSDSTPVSEDEIRVLIRQGVQAGVFDEVEEDMVLGVFDLDERRVGALMTPRTEVDWLDLDDPLERNLEIIQSSPHSRFPAAYHSIDEVRGIVRAKDLLNATLTGKPINLHELIREPLFIPESTTASRALELFKQAGTHMALVLSEHGGIEGVLTMNNLIEEIVGSTEIPRAVQREDGTWLLDGLLPVSEVKEILDIQELPNEGEGHYQTLGGFIMAQLGHIPQEADQVAWDVFHFEVVDMDGKRVDKVLVRAVGGDGEPDIESKSSR